MHPLLLAPLILARLHLQTLDGPMTSVVEQRVSVAEVRPHDLPWPSRSQNLAHAGRGIAVIFSSDLSTRDNRAFYESLGFTFIESADWNEVLTELETVQQSAHPVGTILIESHGANGNGLKLQEGKEAEAARSYIALGALQQRLAPLHIRVALVSACNAGRLFRPEIYNALDRNNGDPLFLPATRGIIDAASTAFDDERQVRLLRRSESELETLVEGTLEDFPAPLRHHFSILLGREGRFTISTMLMQVLLGDDSLRLTSRGYVTEKSTADLTTEESESLFSRFVATLSESVPADL